MKTIEEVLDYLYSFINYETDSSYSYESIHYNVDRTRRLLELLNNPEKDKKIIHVAGTKGKGSVCHILSALLRVQNYKTGLFTSPHIDRVNERITVNGREIENDEFIEITNILFPLIRTFPSDNVPTTFEILTAMAMYYFRMKGACYTVLETGMGGRFDSTNFSDPVVSIITPISYDHTDKLGRHIKEIAAEKAGIIKRGKPVVLGYQKYDVTDIFKIKSEEGGSRFYITDELCSFEVIDESLKGSRFNVNINGLYLKDIFISLAGRHQVENAVTALLALGVLDLLPEEQMIRDALCNIHISARLEIIDKSRRFLLDSAHNEDSARVLVNAVKDICIYDRLFTIVGIVKGKDVKGILKNLSRVSDRLIVTEPVTHKDLDTTEVCDVARKLFPSAVVIKSIERAIKYAVDSSEQNDLILITGSFYTTSPAKKIITGGVSDITGQP